MHTRLRNFPNVLRVDPEFFGIHTDHLAAVLDACLRRDSATAARLQYDYLVSMGDRLAKVLRAQMESLEKG